MTARQGPATCKAGHPCRPPFTRSFVTNPRPQHNGRVCTVCRLCDRERMVKHRHPEGRPKLCGECGRDGHAANMCEVIHEWELMQRRR